MSYEKQTWATGDVITADKLNYMEDGIATIPPIMIVRYINDSSEAYTGGRLDKTWQELYDFRVAGGIVVGLANIGDSLLTSLVDEIFRMHSEGEIIYSVVIKVSGYTLNFSTTNSNDYPQQE